MAKQVTIGQIRAAAERDGLRIEDRGDEIEIFPPAGFGFELGALSSRLFCFDETGSASRAASLPEVYEFVVGTDYDRVPEPAPRALRARSLSTVETARLIRKALRAVYPGTKFSVRSRTYAGGSSIDVRWTDGPTSREVETVTDGFAGGGFDGSIDLAYHVESWLSPDGTATAARSTGTEGSRGAVAGFDYPRPDPEAELVAFGAHYVSTSRDLTVERARVARDLCALQGVEFLDLDQRGLLGTRDDRFLSDHVRDLLGRTSFPVYVVYAGVRFGDVSGHWCEVSFG